MIARLFGLVVPSTLYTGVVNSTAEITSPSPSIPLPLPPPYRRRHHVANLAMASAMVICLRI